MRLRSLVFLVAVGGGIVAFGQTGANSLTVTASRTLAVAPDQAGIAIQVAAPITASLDEVLAPLAGLGISLSNLTGAGTTYTDFNQPLTSWNFSLYVPFAQVPATVAALNALQQSQSSRQYSFYTIGMQTSAAQLAAAPCSLADLLADAQGQARRIAAVSGGKVGPVLALQSGNSAVASGSYAANPAFLAVAVRSAFFLLSPNVIPVQPACEITVKFGLTH